MQADIKLVTSLDGGASWSAPVRVNQDRTNADQFQPYLRVTPRGQLNISYFDRRLDRPDLPSHPGNFFIDTWLSRSNNGGATWKDSRVSHDSWTRRSTRRSPDPGRSSATTRGWSRTTASPCRSSTTRISQTIPAATRSSTSSRHERPSSRSLPPWFRIAASSAAVPATVASRGSVEPLPVRRPTSTARSHGRLAQRAPRVGRSPSARPPQQSPSRSAARSSLTRHPATGGSRHPEHATRGRPWRPLVNSADEDRPEGATLGSVLALSCSRFRRHTGTRGDLSPFRLDDRGDRDRAHRVEPRPRRGRLARGRAERRLVLTVPVPLVAVVAPALVGATLVARGGGTQIGWILVLGGLSVAVH